MLSLLQLQEVMGRPRGAELLFIGVEGVEVLQPRLLSSLACETYLDTSRAVSEAVSSPNSASMLGNVPSEVPCRGLNIGI